MKVALIGAGGFVGSKILAEALSRGHQVTAIGRDASKVEAAPGLTFVAADVHDTGALAAALKGHDAAISAYNPGRGMTADDLQAQFVAGHKAVIAGVKAAGVKRFLAVGGGGSLKVEGGIEWVDSHHFPPAWAPFKGGILGTRALYYLLKEEPDLDWVFLAPSANLGPGERTGKFRLGHDEMLFDAEGVSRISLEDYAVAMIDELETPKHRRERFTVGY